MKDKEHHDLSYFSTSFFALLLSAILTSSVSAEGEQARSTAGQVIAASGCGEFVASQRVAAEELGNPMTRAEVLALVTDCTSGALQELMVRQQEILANLNTEFAQLNLRIDANNQIIDENNQIIAFIVEIDGQFVIQRQLKDEIAASEAEIAATEVRIAAMLAEAERILQTLATQ